MRSIVLYYSYAGSTRREAERLAAELGAAIEEIKEKRKRSGFGTFMPGCIQAMKRKAVHIEPLTQELEAFDRILIGCPIWAGFPAPAFNSIVQLLPAGKQVELFFCSGGGEEPKSEAGNKALVEKMGCTLIGYRDVCTGKTEEPGK